MLFFKRCPSCGRRFGVSSDGRTLVGAERETEEEASTVLVPGGRGRNVGTGTPVTTTAEVTTERDSYETRFLCSKCGHAWSEKSAVVRHG